MLGRLFAVDPRSLALFRILLGGILLADLVVRAEDLGAMYTDSGMFPRPLICGLATSVWNWSFHFASGSGGYQVFLFSLAVLLAFGLLIGMQTRLATIGSWLMLISLHHRVPPILSGADLLLRMLLFWAVFLPLGQKWSWDSVHRGGGKANAPILSIPSAAILLQMGLLYLFSAIFKTNSDWLSGDAIAGTLAHDFYASPFGATFLQFPRLLESLTWATLALEWLAPMLLFSPFRTASCRLIAISVLSAMHVGIALLLEVDLFSPVAIAGLCVFVPREFWEYRKPLSVSERSFGRPAVRWPQYVCLASLLYVFALNINTLTVRPLAFFAPEKCKPLATGCGFSQRWGMFAAVPSKNGWHVCKAILRNGTKVDLLRDGAVLDWNKPPFPARTYRNYRWRKLFREMAYDDSAGYQLLRAPVCAFMCRDWNLHHEPEMQVAEFELIYCHDSPSPRNDAPAMTRERFVHLEFNDS